MIKFRLFGKSKPAQTAKALTDDIPVVSLLDRFSTYPSKGLTPERLASLLREADDGDVYRQMELFEEMLEKDGKLFSLSQSRCLGVSRRSYEIMPGSEDPKDVEIATAAKEMFSRIKGWNLAVRDLLDAIPKGFSVMQILWTAEDGRYNITGFKHLHQKKFRFGSLTDLDGDPEQLRLIIEPRHLEQFRGLVPEPELAQASTNGLALDCDPLFRKRFAVMIAKSRTGNPGRTSLLRTAVWPFLFKNYDIKWWIQFAETLLGYRIGKYDPNELGQMELLKQAVRSLSTDSTAVISKNSEIEFKEALGKATSHQVYGDIKDWANDEESLIFLGHTGSSESTPGRLGGEDSAEQRFQELIEADAATLDETVTDDVLRTWVDLNYGPQDKYPTYKTHIEPAKDLLGLVKLVRESQGAGHQVSKKYFIDAIGIPSPDPKDPDDEALVPTQTGFLTAGKDDDSTDGKKKLLKLRR